MHGKRTESEPRTPVAYDGTDGNTDGDTDTGADSDLNTDADPDTDSNAYTDTDTVADADTDARTDPDTPHHRRGAGCSGKLVSERELRDLCENR
jgi:hypothetical protein